MKIVWESEDHSVKVVDCGDRYSVVRNRVDRSTPISEYWKDSSSAEALHFAIEEANSISKLLQG